MSRIAMGLRTADDAGRRVGTYMRRRSAPRVDGALRKCRHHKTVRRPRRPPWTANQRRLARRLDDRAPLSAPAKGRRVRRCRGRHRERQRARPKPGQQPGGDRTACAQASAFRVNRGSSGRGRARHLAPADRSAVGITAAFGGEAEEQHQRRASTLARCIQDTRAGRPSASRAAATIVRDPPVGRPESPPMPVERVSRIDDAQNRSGQAGCR